MPRQDILVHAVKGVRLGTVAAGIRSAGDSVERDDIAVIELSEGSNTSAVFTRNQFCAAPVNVAREHLKKHLPSYLLINSGNANAGTGMQGHSDCLETCRLLAAEVHCLSEQILPFSTGVIGERMPPSLFESTLPVAVNALSDNPEAWNAAARAIMTTDTLPKQASIQYQYDGRTVTITGIAKGSGMIRPDMATMLAYIATDAEIESGLLDECLRWAVNRSFNRISVDGDTSTNDACVLMATGKSNTTISLEDEEGLQQFQNQLDKVCVQLAQAIVRDGEGATKFITIEVNGGASKKECLDVAYTIAHSPLVKTAFFASDPNWGRLVAAIGRAGIEDLDLQKLSINLGNVSLIEKGEPASSYTEEDGVEVMAEREISINIDLARGRYSEVIWTCDLSYDYVKINAEYRT